MAQDTEVVVDINHEGGIHIEVAHHKGPSCKKLLAAFNGLGKVKDEGTKPEYFKPDTTRNMIQSKVTVR